MANEAFALSPMSARAAEPNEQDYDAIREAFMETARGRWFLGEYAKRNRNADTRMVLDAVAKIEETLAAQRQPVVEDRLPEALVAIRRAVEDTEAAAGKAFDPAAIAAGLAPIHRGIRIIKEISWRWREIGADGRICDLIDSQLASIESACAQVSTIDPRTELKAAFDLLKDRIEQTDADGDAAPQAAARPSPAPVQEAQPVAEVSPVEAAPATRASDTPVAFTEAPQDVVPEPEAAIEETSVANAAMDVASEPETVAENHVAVEEAVAEPAAFAETTDELPFDAAAEAEDEAVLERIAFEMAAPDPDFDEIVEPMEMAADIREPIAAEAAVAPIVEEPAVAPVAEEPAAAPVAAQAPAVEAPIAAESLARLTDAIAEAAAEVMEHPAPAIAPTAPLTMAPTATLPMPSPLSEPSLGATILSSGILQKPRAPANDSLAPIRRMTQAEKIAFFS
ncbi:hypothetical protein AYJ54_23590 [Bradyrhizobium centrolobii]|uniref:Chemotaxis protein CheZ n=1 Tax=Bradyrhizobium centrolobii TaxID=1505087 RepID=A0A176YE14_9BRAD|nr:hypothetical protein [Bradyrhizobium centrolobii]OAF04825.1 hypothetical protein AYJ54_23590 [Bradyrhizobium centrolobii]